MTFWARPDAQEALAARAMDRAPVHEAMRAPRGHDDDCITTCTATDCKRFHACQLCAEETERI